MRARLSPPLSLLEVALAALAACVIAAAMHWPLPLHLGRDVSRDIGDPLVQAWEVAWGGHALRHQPLDYFQANTFWPLRNSLAFSDALVGYAPAGAIGEGPHAAIVRYNLLFLFSYVLAFLGAYLLARELGLGRAGAAVAGAAFAYAPWRLEQDGHLHVLSSGGIPLALFLLLRGYRRDAPGTVLAGWLVAAWQLSLGFTLGLQLAYLLGALGLAGVVWSWRRRRRLPPPVLAATLCGLIALAATAVLLSRPYVQVLDDHPEAHRTRAQVVGLSPPVRSFIAAPEQNFIWGNATKPVRDELSSVPEQTLFPGAAIVALALIGLVGPPLPRRLRVGLGVATLACAVLSLGFTEHGSPLLHPYRLLFDHAPGWSGIRVPGRLTTLVSLTLALLAAAGADRLAGGAVRRRSAAVAGLLVLAVLLEGSGFDLEGNGFLSGPSHPRVPAQHGGVAQLPAPQLHLPITTPANRRYVIWSTDRFPKLVNGRGSFEPRFFVKLTHRVERFPDRSSVATLGSLGVRTVVFHRSLAPGTVWAGVARRSIHGLGITREDHGELVVYRISGGSPADGDGRRAGP
jgi:hypothetical protein